MKNNADEKKERAAIKKEKRKKPFPHTAAALIFSVLTVIFAVTLTVVCIWGSRQKRLAENSEAEAEKLRTAAEGIYEEAFTELVSSVYNIHIGLSKLLVSAEPSTIAFMLNDIQRESGLCAGLMGQIPQSHAESRELNGFLIRIGDYAGCLSKSVMQNLPLCDTDSKQLISLYETSEKIYNELLYRLENNEFPKENITTEEFFMLNTQDNTDNAGNTGRADSKGNPDSTNSADSTGGADNKADTGNNESAAKEEKKFPTLIYDGPFSESTEKLEPRGICGNRINPDEALIKAKRFLNDENAVLTLATVSDGRIPSYDFAGKLTGGRTVDIGITVCGGHLLFMRIDSTGETEGLPSEIEKFELSQKGSQWLASIGYTNMKPVAMRCYSGCALISYAAVQKGVIIYNDLVKISIDRASREIAGADARDYLFSHIRREFPETILSEKEIKGFLSPNLCIEACRLTFIPVTPQKELMCYEFRCSFGNAEYAVYLDAQTGSEITILRIIKDETGELAL